MTYDTHHAHIEEHDTGASIRACGRRINHVHISENDRGTPGKGQVRWHETFEALHANDYGGWLTIESFSRASPEFAAAIRRHSSHARAEALAAALESATGFVARDWRGFRANWQC